MKILSCDRLSRLSLEGMENEPIHRRLVVDKSAKRFRHLMASIFWDSKMTQWLHNTLCDNLPMEYLSAYLDILQTLRAKCSALVDKMVAGRILKEEGLAKITKDGVRILLKKRWDPANSSINQQKLVSKHFSSSFREHDNVNSFFFTSEKVAGRPHYYLHTVRPQR